MAIDTIGTNAIANKAVTDAKLAASLNLSSKTVVVPSSTVTTHVTPTDLTPVKQDLDGGLRLNRLKMTMVSIKC